MRKELLVGATMLTLSVVTRLVERRRATTTGLVAQQSRWVDEMADRLERTHDARTNVTRRRERKVITSLLRSRFDVAVAPGLPSVKRIHGRLDRIVGTRSDGGWRISLFDDHGDLAASYRVELTDNHVLLTDPVDGAAIADRAGLAANLRLQAARHCGRPTEQPDASGSIRPMPVG